MGWNICCSRGGRKGPAWGKGMVGMIGLTRWLTGWVEFSIQGKKKGQAERFLTLSARSGFCFWGMEPEGEGFRCRVRAVEYPELRSGARRCRVRLRVLRRRGLPFWQQKLCRRKGLALGGAVFCLLLWFLSGRFWIITGIPLMKRSWPPH